jgi:carboxyl-terminal processing protease
MTIAEFFRINGDSTQLHGVMPDIRFPHSIGYKDYGESSYPNALKWTHIASAEYTPVADQQPLVVPLTAEHDARAKTDPAWQLLLDELAAARKLHDTKTISLNFKVREAERKQRDAEDATFKKRRGALGDVSAISLEPDDGLTPGERSDKQSVAREKAAKQAKDIELEEAAHIMADEVALLAKDRQLAHDVLPKQSFGGPPSLAGVNGSSPRSAPTPNSAPATAPAPTSSRPAEPASASSSH